MLLNWSKFDLKTIEERNSKKEKGDRGASGPPPHFRPASRSQPGPGTRTPPPSSRAHAAGTRRGGRPRQNAHAAWRSCGCHNGHSVGQPRPKGGQQRSPCSSPPFAPAPVSSLPLSPLLCARQHRHCHCRHRAALTAFSLLCHSYLRFLLATAPPHHLCH